MDNLNTTHESFKLELENRHSEKVEELKKEYESSFSGKYFVFKYMCYSTASHKKNIQAFWSLCPLHCSLWPAIFKNIGWIPSFGTDKSYFTYSSNHDSIVVEWNFWNSLSGSDFFLR